ncbi:hypothetical protein [Burkholderia cepacia]|uniref:hypothetical protein n=1 Tax=Burkholderia cepacia TaxID=292 RepID=UPI001CF1105F|nr:hypothetical protein [Burkholderia cepacia]MCA8026425.1 hypothetical protein [Burkholderia cepacia]
MAKLSSAARDKLPAGKFAGPDRSYPIPDASHAANAKARSTQAVKAGRMSEGEKEKIDARADKVLDKGKSKKSYPVPDSPYEKSGKDPKPKTPGKAAGDSEPESGTKLHSEGKNEPSGKRAAAKPVEKEAGAKKREPKIDGKKVGHRMTTWGRG